MTPLWHRSFEQERDQHVGYIAEIEPQTARDLLGMIAECAARHPGRGLGRGPARAVAHIRACQLIPATGSLTVGRAIPLHRDDSLARLERDRREAHVSRIIRRAQRT